MLNYTACQLLTMILLRHLNRLNAVCADEVIDCRLEELNHEYVKTKTYRELAAEYIKLFHEIQASDDPDQRRTVLFDLDSLMVGKLADTQKFHYLAGIHDAMRIFNVSDTDKGDCP